MTRANGNGRNFRNIGCVTQSARVWIVFQVRGHRANNNTYGAILGGFRWTGTPLIYSTTVGGKGTNPGSIKGSVEKYNLAFNIFLPKLLQLIKVFHLNDAAAHTRRSCSHGAAQCTDIDIECSDFFGVD